MSEEGEHRHSNESTPVLATSICSDARASTIENPSLTDGKESNFKQEDNNSEVNSEDAGEEDVVKEEEEQGNSTESTPVLGTSTCSDEVASGVEALTLTYGKENKLTQKDNNGGVDNKDACEEDVVKEEEEQGHSTESTPVLETSTCSDDHEVASGVEASVLTEGKENKLKQEDNNATKDQGENSQIPTAERTEGDRVPTLPGTKNHQTSEAQKDPSLLCSVVTESTESNHGPTVPETKSPQASGAEKDPNLVTTNTESAQSGRTPTVPETKSLQTSGAQKDPSLVTADKQNQLNAVKDRDPKDLREPTSDNVQYPPPICSIQPISYTKVKAQDRATTIENNSEANKGKYV